jgi:homoserine trans-succinylase
MNSREWDMYGWKKVKNPSGEMARTKQYIRYLQTAVNLMPYNIKVRKQLAEILQVPPNDLMGELTITIDTMKHKHITKEYNLKKYRRRLK